MQNTEKDGPGDSITYHMQLALFPGLPTVQFLVACSMQKRRGKAWYHLMTSVST